MAQKFEYKHVRTQSQREIQPALDQHAKENWKLVGTVVAEGNTVGLIFERDHGTESNEYPFGQH